MRHEGKQPDSEHFPINCFVLYLWHLAKKNSVKSALDGKQSNHCVFCFIKLSKTSIA